MDANNRHHWFLDPGPVSAWIDQFPAGLAAQGYTPLTIDGYTASARHFAIWLNGEGIPISAIDDNVVRRFAAHRCRCPGGRQWRKVSPKYAQRAKRLCIFLQQSGVASATVQSVSPLVSRFPRLDDYQDWLRIHRGLSEPTIARHLRDLRRLLPELGAATHDYDATLVRHVVPLGQSDLAKAGARVLT